MATTVVHVNRDRDYDIYIGRAVRFRRDLTPQGWGNPFSKYNLPAGYHDAVSAFCAWLHDSYGMHNRYVRERQWMLAHLHELRGKKIACWCAPKGGLPGDLNGHTCHGEILAAMADALESEAN